MLQSGKVSWCNQMAGRLIVDLHVVYKQHCAKYSGHNSNVSTLEHPVEHVDSESEADKLFTDAHGDQHFRGIGGICVAR